MKKLIIKIVIIVAVIALVVVPVVMYFTLNSAITAAANAVVPKVTGTPFHLGSARISIFSGEGVLKGVALGNPEGFSPGNAFAVDEVKINVNLRSLGSDKIIIEEIYIDAPQIVYEMSTSGSNIAKIQKNIEEYMGKEEAEPPADERAKKKVQIDHFVLKNGTVSVAATFIQGKAVTVPMPDVEMRDIGAKSIGEMAKELFNPISDAISAAADEGMKLFKKHTEFLRDGSVKEGLDKSMDQIKGIFNKKK